ncbi:NTP transferase domain-containing protein [Candidatus Micrarchaeota archaeon]|nr:NTP transferase domain-containing protein [Candidatus Micrarchaeota archaeon]
MAKAQKTKRNGKKKAEPPTCILLCGGASSRFAPLTDKPTFKFCGKTLVEWQLDAIAKAGVGDTIVVASPANEQRIRDAVQRAGVNAKITVQKEPKGQGDAVLAGLQAAKFNSPVYITSAHEVVEPELHGMVLAEFQKGADGVIAAYRVKEYLPGGYLKLKNGKIEGIKEKPGKGAEPSDVVNMVFHSIKPSSKLSYLLKRHYSNRRVTTDDHYELALDDMFKEYEFKPAKYTGEWKPLKYPWHVLDVMQFFLSRQKPRISPKAQVSSKAVVEGAVVIEDGARVLENAVIRGPTYVGKNAVIGNGSLVLNSHVGEGSVVGFASEVTRSYIGDKCWLHNNYVGDSIVEDNVMLTYGAGTTNLRFDEAQINVNVKGEAVNTGRIKLGAIIGSGARIGSRATLGPGVKVGRNSWVAPHAFVNQDIPDNSYAEPNGAGSLSVKQNTSRQGTGRALGLGMRAPEKVK